jgi:release factor glutamine methyltransferase
MVEQARSWLESHPGLRKAADVGTGSGCVAVALAHNTPDLQITATDISTQAVEVAKSNAEKHQVAERIQFVQADLLPVTSPSTYHLICANLPYIPTKTLERLDVFGKEPTLALDGGPDGLDLVRKLLPTARQTMTLESLLLLEIEHTQGKTALHLAEEYFPEAQITLLTDLAGHDRLLRIENQ